MKQESEAQAMQPKTAQLSTAKDNTAQHISGQATTGQNNAAQHISAQRSTV
jgi:hypothetical protein